jgi:hypothetical protein
MTKTEYDKIADNAELAYNFAVKKADEELHAAKKIYWDRLKDAACVRAKVYAELINRSEA